MANETNLEDACKVFGITSRWYRKLSREGVVPESVKGKIDFIRACRDLIEYYRKLAQGQGSLSLTDERTRLTKHQADMAELELQEKKGKLVDVLKAGELIEKMIMAFRSRVLSIPVKAAPLAVGAKNIPEAKEIIENYVYEALTELSRIDPADFFGAGKAKADKPAPKDDRKPVGRSRKGIKPRGKRRTR